MKKNVRQRVVSLLLAVVMTLGLCPAALATTQPLSEIDHVIIRQVYGGGGKGDTPISNSFVELYNPTASEVDLSGYTLNYDTKVLSLSGSIPAGGSYLVVGAAEKTSDDFLTYDLPTADLTCDWTINNKSYTIKLMNSGEETIDSVTAGDSTATKISKQKSLKRNNNGELGLVVWEKVSVTVDDAYVTANAPCNSKGEKGKVHADSSEPEPEYTPVVTGDVRVKGYYNETAPLKLELAGRHNSGAMNADGGSLEIVQYNPVNGFAYAVSGVKGKLIAVDLNGKLDGEKTVELTGKEYDLKTMVSVKGFNYGDMTSVAISPDGSKLAAALQDKDYEKPGRAAVFSCNADGSLTLLDTAAVGVQPDMVTFADNSTILTADEGEPRNGKAAEDPKGSVSIVTIGENNKLSVDTVTFDGFDAKRSDLTAAGVLIQKERNPSADFEPEYIAVSGNTAYVSLQEANAIAVLDIANKTFTGVYPLGFQNYGTTKVDLQKNDAIELKNYENVCGIKMPDGISVASIGGKTYLLTANEGDSRSDWENMDNEFEDKTSPTGNVTLDEKVVWFNANMWDGLDTEKAYVFGGRSFSIYEVSADGLHLVYDSGSGFEEITAAQMPDYFNCSNDKTTLDNRSGKKGPEPETVVTGTVDGKTYAFIALERIGGIMVYDITDPANTVFVNYINSREFDDKIKGDVSPEGLCFIPAASSKTGKPMLLAACEVSGTLAAYELTAVNASGGGSGSGGSGSGSSGSSSSGTTTTTEKNADGSTTTTTTDKTTGTVTETTQNTDGSVTVVETKKDGTVTETNKTADGVTGTTVTNSTGAITEIKAEIPAAAAAKNETITLPVEVPTATSTNTAAAVAIKVDSAFGSVKVEIPTARVTAGTVAVIVNADGSEQVVKTSLPTDQGVTLEISGNVTVKLVDRSPVFADVHTVGHWSEDAVNFVAARDIFNGTTATTFSPDVSATRGMLARVLYNLENNPDMDAADGFEDVKEDAYYADAVKWAAQRGVVSGYGNSRFGPEDDITREQLAAILYRYAGSPAVNGRLTGFADAGQASAYAQNSLAWAVDNGIMNGKGSGILDPTGLATRGEVAQMMRMYLSLGQ